MSKTPKKAAKSASKKAPAKVKAKAKPKLKMKASVKPVENSPGSRRGFMWKALEQKQQKQKEQQQHSNVNPLERARPTATPQGFSRFNGPRRRVG